MPLRLVRLRTKRDDTAMIGHANTRSVLLVVNAAGGVPKAFVTFRNYNGKSVFVIGVIHGLGAETPTQLLIFLLAANLGGVGKGFLGLGMFLAGLLAMNTLMTASATGLFGFSTRMPRFQFAVTALTAVYSLTVGSIFLLGYSASLMPLVR